MKKKLLVIPVLLLLVLIGISSCAKVEPNDQTSGFPYDTIMQKGYTGSQEELIASLVGEELSPYNEEKSAYELAAEKGYSGSIEEWMKTLTGAESSDAKKSAYSVACENGYDGTLAEWLTSLCEKPDEMGKSVYGESKTDYEYACEYGYEGSFIEWMISLINDKEL